MRNNKAMNSPREKIPNQFFGSIQLLRIGKLISIFRLNGKSSFLKYSKGTTEVCVNSQVDEEKFADDADKKPPPANCLYPTPANKGINRRRIHLKLFDSHFPGLSLEIK